MIYYLKFNLNNLNSVRRAERNKSKLENKGFNLTNSFVNSITGDCCSQYEK